MVLCCWALLCFFLCCLWRFNFFSFKNHCCFSLPLKLFLKNKKLKYFLLCNPALPCSVVRYCAVLPCVAGFLCVCCLVVVCRVVRALWCSFPPCWHAQHHTVMVFDFLPPCDPASFSVSTGMLVLVMMVLAASLMLMSVLVLEDFESGTGYPVTAACREKEAEGWRVGQELEDEVHGE